MVTPVRLRPFAAAAAALAAAAAATALPACIVRPDVYDVAYTCEGEGASTCASGNSCSLGAAGNFCAPECGAGCPGDAICSDQNLCLDRCTDDGDCLAGLSCVLSESGGYCTLDYTCSSDQDCRDFLATGATSNAQCSSNIAGLSAGNSCIFTCLSDEECPPGHTCEAYGFGGTDPKGNQLGVCTTECTSTRGCPPTNACLTSTALGVDGACFIGIGGVQCESDTNCLVGACDTVGENAGDICTIPCETDSDCAALEVLGFTYVCDTTGGAGSCAFFGEVCGGTLCDSLSVEVCARAIVPGAPLECYQLEFCDATFRPCPPGEASDCIDETPADPTSPGLCAEPCASAADCSTDGWGCVPGDAAWGGLANHCFFGVPFVRCVDDTDCVEGATCVNFPLAGGWQCQVPCTMDSECDFLNPADGSVTWLCSLGFGMWTYCQAQ
jgi:hypothetical protein